MQITDSVVVITGGGRGLGRATAEYLADRGARVALVDVDIDNLNDVVAHTESLAGEVRAYQADIAVESEVEQVFRQIESDMGAVSVLLNNAGILRDALLVKARDGEVSDRMSLSDWQAVINVNLTGVFLCGREAATCMIASKTAGVIINISSISRLGNAGQSNYAAAKAGVAALTTTWARELARYGIRSVGIAPGVFETEMVASMKPEAHDRITGLVPIKRTGELDEFAHSVAYIIENDYLNGRLLELDGGLRF